VNANGRALPDARAITASVVFTVVAGFALWPPRAVYWTAVAAAVGETATLALVVALAVALGAAFESVTGVGVRAFAVGAALAYLLGMATVALALSPDSPAHLVLYGAIDGCLLAGVAAASVR